MKVTLLHFLRYYCYLPLIGIFPPKDYMEDLVDKNYRLSNLYFGISNKQIPLSPFPEYRKAAYCKRSLLRIYLFDMLYPPAGLVQNLVALGSGLSDDLILDF